MLYLYTKRPSPTVKSSAFALVPEETDISYGQMLARVEVDWAVSLYLLVSGSPAYGPCVCLPSWAAEDLVACH